MHKGRLISSRKTCCINKDQYVQVNVWPNYTRPLNSAHFLNKKVTQTRWFWSIKQAVDHHRKLHNCLHLCDIVSCQIWCYSKSNSIHVGCKIGPRVEWCSWQDWNMMLKGWTSGLENFALKSSSALYNMFDGINDERTVLCFCYDGPDVRWEINALHLKTRNYGIRCAKNMGSSFFQTTEN